jgi:hypothetical protein
LILSVVEILWRYPKSTDVEWIAGAAFRSGYAPIRAFQPKDCSIVWRAIMAISACGRSAQRLGQGVSLRRF